MGRLCSHHSDMWGSVVSTATEYLCYNIRNLESMSHSAGARMEVEAALTSRILAGALGFAAWEGACTQMLRKTIIRGVNLELETDWPVCF